MTQYMNGKIYKIVCNTTNECYIGSTTQTLCKRLATHVQDYKKYLKSNHGFVTSYPILERGNYNIILLEEVNCENREQLHRAERKHIETNVCLNHCIPTRDWKEYREANQQKHDEYMTQWKNENKEHIKEWRKDYNEVNKERNKISRKLYLSQRTEEQIVRDKEKKKEYDKQRKAKK